MKKIISLLLVLIVFSISISILAAGTEVTSTDLIEKAKEYDGQTVTYKGEIIGDIMNRGEYAWINISDGSNAIGIYVLSSSLDGITMAGNYGSKGDVVTVTGVYHRACADHGGDLDIHASTIALLEKGGIIDEPHDLTKEIIATVLFVAACIATVFVAKKVILKKK